MNTATGREKDRWAVAETIHVARIKLAWGNAWESRVAAFPKTDKERRAYLHNPVAEIDLALACADAVLALSPSPERQEAGETAIPTNAELIRDGDALTKKLEHKRDHTWRVVADLTDAVRDLSFQRIACGWLRSMDPSRAEPSLQDAELIGRLAEMIRKSRKTIANICSSAGVLIDDSKFVVEIEGALRDAASRLSSLSAKETRR